MTTREATCPGSGRRALRSLLDQNVQTCPKCGQRVWLTAGGYLEAHTPTRVRP